MNTKLPHVLSKLAFILITLACIAVQARTVPPRALMPWQDQVAQIQADFTANPLDPRFARILPEYANPPGAMVSANEADLVDAVIVEWWCSSDGNPDEWDDMWMAIIGSSVNNGADAYVYLLSYYGHDDQTTRDTCSAMLEDREGVAPTAVTWIQGAPTDTFWIRDFGPLFVREANSLVLSIEDPKYYPGRDYDDTQPAEFASRLGIPHSQFSLNFEGGNFLPNGTGICLISDVVMGMNPQYNETEIKQMFRQDLGCDNLIILETLEDYATGHVDMWLAWADQTTLLVGEYEEEQDSDNREIIENNILNHLTGLTDTSTGNPIQIVRIPMPSNCPSNSNGMAPQSCNSVGGWNRIWRSYLNIMEINGTVLLPVYAEDNFYESEAIQVWQSLGFQVRNVFSDLIIPNAGTIHCITKTLDSAPTNPEPPAPNPTPEPPPVNPTPEPTAKPPSGGSDSDDGGGLGCGCTLGKRATRSGNTGSVAILLLLSLGLGIMRRRRSL